MSSYYRPITFKEEFSVFIKTVFYIVIVAILFLVITLVITLGDISRMASYTYNSTYAIPHNRAGLVLGTAKYLVKGGLNQYFINRIDATTELFKAGKIDYVVVSGDNAHRTYNEPREMRKALMARGIPKEKIYLDYAGFSTLDSVVRIEQIFRQKSITIISQDFHNERAIYIARHHNIEAIGFNAKGVDKQGFTESIREFLARIKCILDVYIFDSKPKFLGETIEIGKANIDPKHAQLQESPPKTTKETTYPQAPHKLAEPILPPVVLDLISKEKLGYNENTDSGN